MIISLSQQDMMRTQPIIDIAHFIDRGRRNLNMGIPKKCKINWEDGSVTRNGI